MPGHPWGSLSPATRRAEGSQGCHTSVPLSPSLHMLRSQRGPIRGWALCPSDGVLGLGCIRPLRPGVLGQEVAVAPPRLRPEERAPMPSQTRGPL